jgi:hypothetical protein
MQAEHPKGMHLPHFAHLSHKFIGTLYANEVLHNLCFWIDPLSMVHRPSGMNIKQPPIALK